MKMQRLGKAARPARWRAACTFAIVLAGGFAPPAAAADSTGKPIRLIVPFSPGGSSDVVARSKLYPDVPTIAEAGLKGYEMTSWFGVVVPAKTPKPTIDALYAAITDAVKRPDFAEQLAVQGIEPAHTTPAELAALVAREIPLYAKIVKEANVRPE